MYFDVETGYNENPVIVVDPGDTPGTVPPPPPGWSLLGIADSNSGGNMNIDGSGSINYQWSRFNVFITITTSAGQWPDNWDSYVMRRNDWANGPILSQGSITVNRGILTFTPDDGSESFTGLFYADGILDVPIVPFPF